MPGTPTTGSSKIAVLDSKVIANQCDGKFYIDISPSTWIGSGKTTIDGANVKIENPFGVVIKDYGADYEIAPDLSGGMDAQVVFNIPTQAGNYQYGQYKIYVELFDGDESWVVVKTLKLCEPDKNNKTRNYGSLAATLKASCKDGKLYVIVNPVPTYQGKTAESQVNDLTLLYPTVSEVEPLETDRTSFSVQLFEGEYKLSGEICALYHLGDNVYVQVKYKVKVSKNAKCVIDECCVFSKLSDLHLQITKNCTEEERQNAASITLDALRLLKTAQLAADCGEDPTTYVEELEDLLGCTCTCACNEGTPIINQEVSKDFSIEGCNVEKSTVGSTDVYTIENYEYKVSIVENGGVITVAAATTEGCVKTQVITFNIATAYAQIKELSDADYAFWASVINKVLTPISIPSCMGISQGTWDGYTLQQRIAAIINKINSCCCCDAEVEINSVTSNGSSVTLNWTNNSSVFSVDIYVDGELVSTKLDPVTTATLKGYADGVTHTYRIVPKCSDGKLGVPFEDEFLFLGCPTIDAPQVSQDAFVDEECPFDVTSYVSLPVGTTLEVHNANNTDPSSLVDAEALASGVYWLFANNGEGCYSSGVQITVICDTDASCSAPQNLTVAKSGSNFLVQFQSAAFPPPSNSYTVKRKLAADPDVDGSYTTIGTPTWNATTSRWQIMDTSAIDNRLYTWKAISNCGDSPATTPSITTDWANITCPDPALTLTSSSIEYDFSPAGDVDEYQVKLYDSSGTVLLDTDTHSVNIIDPVPINGIFEYLTAETNYKIKITGKIGSFSKTCASISTATTA